MTMRLTSRTAVLLALTALLTAPLSAQLPTGKLTGVVVGPDGEGLPGVTVTVRSPSLQGERQRVTGANGTYLFPLLPPGEYEATFQLDGMRTQVVRVRVTAAQTTTHDTQMEVSAVEEEITVTGALEGVSQNETSATTYSVEFLDKLPVGRTMRSAVLLSPGTHATGPKQATSRAPNISISGSMSYENLFLINGVVVNENLRGQPFSLFIEDAIQETTTSVSGISAEYGRFAGGVVNMITKAGGNEIHGSVRSSFTNDDWSATTPLTEEQVDNTVDTLEATLGGWFWKNHIWFFTAGRDFEDSATEQTVITNIPFTETTEEERLEGKLTISPASGHTIVGSYIDVDLSAMNFTARPVLELDAVDDDREQPQELVAFHYNGVLTPSFFVEAQHSEREFTFVDSGGDAVGDLIEGTVLFDQVNFADFHSPFFCGPCSDESRDNENTLVKASYFLSSEAAGAHDIVFGYDTFTDIRAADNHQSASGFHVWSDGHIVTGSGANRDVVPIINPFSSLVVWWPIFESTQGTDFETNSIFVNDSWNLNEHWSFNIGLRYDENDGVDSSGAKRVDDSKLSPRLAANYDLHGDGEWVFSASAGNYTTAIANTIADSQSSAGIPAILVWLYGGAPINTAGAPITSEAALAQVFDWFEGIGGTGNLTSFFDPAEGCLFLLLGVLPDCNGFIVQSTVPGTGQVIGDDLSSPSVDEFTVGVRKRLGNRGLLRADYIRREFEDFYFRRATTETGTVEINEPAAGVTGLVVDREIFENNDSILERKYDAVQGQVDYRFDRLQVGGNYTWSHARGNFDGETLGAGPVASTKGLFPEFKDFENHLSRGDLAIDQRHKARIWAIYDVLRSERHGLSIGLLSSFLSGGPYGAAGGVASSLFVENPGYISPPDDVNYWFLPRDAFTTEDITTTDLTFNYAFQWRAFGTQMEVFIQPQILNVFNEHGIASVETDAVLDATVDPSFEDFNPFTEEPVRGVHWDLGEDFGQPENPQSFQLPRTFRFSVGFRF